jgi:hypothetical protein
MRRRRRITGEKGDNVRRQGISMMAKWGDGG